MAVKVRRLNIFSSLRFVFPPFNAAQLQSATAMIKLFGMSHFMREIPSKPGNCVSAVPPS
jgi:hypothetical protein